MKSFIAGLALIASLALATATMLLFYAGNPLALLTLFLSPLFFTIFMNMAEAEKEAEAKAEQAKIEAYYAREARKRKIEAANRAKGIMRFRRY